MIALGVQRFNALLGGPVRQDLLWFKHSACPCVNPASGAADPLCPICGGTGHTWADPVAAWAGVTSQSPRKAYAVFGSWAPGDAVLTIGSDSPLYAAAEFDRIQLLGSSTPFSEVRTPGLNDRMRAPVRAITRVFWLSPDRSTVVEGGVPVVAADGSLSWPNGGAPPEGVSYTVEGLRFLELYVYGPLASNRNSGASGLPLKLAARSFDLLGRS